MRSLLDIGCATGRHLATLHGRAELMGVDVDEELLARARTRLDVPLVQADMCSLELNRRFDAIVCLYGSIAYVRTPERLARAFRSIAAHLRRGGVAVVEPWYRTPETCPRRQARTVTLPHVHIARVSHTLVLASELGDQAEVEVHYLLARDDGVEHRHEIHRLGIFSDALHLAACATAGLDASLVRDGLGPGLDVYIAVKRSER